MSDYGEFADLAPQSSGTTLAPAKNSDYGEFADLVPEHTQTGQYGEFSDLVPKSPTPAADKALAATSGKPFIKAENRIPQDILESANPEQFYDPSEHPIAEKFATAIIHNVQPFVEHPIESAYKTIVPQKEDIEAIKQVFTNPKQAFRRDTPIGSQEWWDQLVGYSVPLVLGAAAKFRASGGKPAVVEPEPIKTSPSTTEDVGRGVVEPALATETAPSAATPTTQGQPRQETGEITQAGEYQLFRGIRGQQSDVRPKYYSNNPNVAQAFSDGEIERHSVKLDNPLFTDNPDDYVGLTSSEINKRKSEGYDGIVYNNGQVVIPFDKSQIRTVPEVSHAPVESVSQPKAEPIGIEAAIAEIQRRNAPAERSPESTAPLPTEETGVPTSTKNDRVDVERDLRGLPPVVEEAKRDFGTVWEQTEQRIAADPTYQDTLVDSLKTNPRAVNDVENAVVLHKQIDLQNQFDKAADDLIVANATGDTVKAGELDTHLARLSDDLLSVYDINKSVGRETARGLGARRMLANEDFSLAKMIVRKRVAKGGEPLTGDENIEVRNQNKEISQLQNKVEAREAELRAQELKTHFKELVRASTEEAQTAKVAKRTITDFLDEQANKARERIRARGGRLMSGVDPIDLADHAIIGASYIAKGVKGFAEWSGSMVKDFGEAVKPYLKELYDRARELHSANAKVFSDARLIAAKKRTTKRIEELQGKVESGDFTKTPRKPPATDKELQDLQFKLSKVKEQYLRGVFQDQLKRRPTGVKAADAVREILNTSRALKTSLDLSAVLRQGGLIAFAHPIRAAKAFPAMFKALASEKGQFKVMNEIESRSNAPKYIRSKLYISDPRTATLSKMEEAYMSRWADKIPLVAASQRAYVTFLNKLRADSFDAMEASLTKRGQATPEEQKAISNYINVATGRGTLDGLSKAAVGLNTIFFAPRYVASRFEYLAGQPFYKGSARTRGLVAKEYARTLVGLGVVYTLGKMAGGMVELDPRSADFGKIRFGNTRIDPLAGLSQSTVLLSRVASGSTKKASGAVVPIRGQVPYGSENTADILANFLRSKLAPIPSSAVNVLAGKNVVGQPVTVTSTAMDLGVPLALSDIYSAMLDQGVDRGTALGLLSVLGMGLQTYSPPPAKLAPNQLFKIRKNASSSLFSR